MRLLAAAFLLLLGSGEDGRASVRECRDGRNTERSTQANISAALTTNARPIDDHTGQPQPSLSEATLDDGRIHYVPSPIRFLRSFSSRERTSTEAARPPPLQA